MSVEDTSLSGHGSGPGINGVEVHVEEAEAIIIIILLKNFLLFTVGVLVLNASLASTGKWLAWQLR